MASHTALYKRLGGTDEQVATLAAFETSNYFSEAEKSALEFAERMTRDAHSVDDDLWNRLHQDWNDGEIVELASVSGLFNYFNRWNDALQTEITR